MLKAVESNRFGELLIDCTIAMRTRRYLLTNGLSAGVSGIPNQADPTLCLLYGMLLSYLVTISCYCSRAGGASFLQYFDGPSVRVKLPPPGIKTTYGA